MTTETIPATEEEQETADQPSERKVPLGALEAERRKRQDLEAQNRTLQDLLTKNQADKQSETSDDDDEFITKAEQRRRDSESKATLKREILEEAYCSDNPEKVEIINAHLEAIIKRKPWLAQSIHSAPNRFARSYEIVTDYMPKEEKTPADKTKNPKADAKKIVENSHKPGNPHAISKTSSMSNADYLKSIAGKPEFREYRKKMLSGG